MKKINWDKAIILTEMYKTNRTDVFISSGETFEKSIQKETWDFKYKGYSKEFVSGVAHYDMTAEAFSLNIYFLDEENEDGSTKHIDFDIGIDI